MSELKPMPATIEKLKNLFEAFIKFSERTGVKVEITIDPTEVEEKDKDCSDRLDK